MNAAVFEQALRDQPPPTKVAVEWSREAPALIEQALTDRSMTALHLAHPDRDGDEEYDEEYELDDDGRPIPPPPVEAGALATLDLSQLVELDLSYFHIGEPGAKALATSTTLGRIEALDLRYCRIGDAGLAALTANPHLSGLRRLHLQFNQLTVEGVRSLQRFEHLTELDLRYNYVGVEGVDALLAAPFVSSITRLLLNRVDVSPAGVKKLALAPHLPPALRSYWRSK